MALLLQSAGMLCVRDDGGKKESEDKGFHDGVDALREEGEACVDVGDGDVCRLLRRHGRKEGMKETIAQERSDATCFPERHVQSETPFIGIITWGDLRLQPLP